MTASRWQLLAWALLSCAMVAIVGLATCVLPGFSFIQQGSEAVWIANPDRVSMGVVSAPYQRLHVVEFTKRFRVEDPAAVLQIFVEALRGFDLELNDRPLAARAWNEGSWREPAAVDLGPALVSGSNRIRIRVRNPSGPPLLRVSAPGSIPGLSSDVSWQARLDGGPASAAHSADDTVRAAEAIPVTRLGDAFRATRTELALLLVAGALLSAALMSRVAKGIKWLPDLVWVPIALVWGIVAYRATSLPAYFGFDGPDHLAYVRLLAQGSLPLASDGAQMHHPPLFYAVSALMLTLFESKELPSRILLRIVPLLSGLVQVGVAFLLAKRLFPGDRLRASATALAAAFLPLNLYMSSYLSNEPLFAAFVALALLVAVDLLQRADAPAQRGALLGALLGLAILTKVSGLILVPVVLGYLALKDLSIERRSLGPALWRGGIVFGSTALVCGWYFIRNQLHFGRALIGNWDVPGNPIAWWQHPGFHTPSYYLSFGESLRRPFFASFDSFWDGLYSTFWGDGLVGGVSAWASRHRLWDYDFMTVGYALAVPATAMILYGLYSLLRSASSTESPGRAAALGLLGSAVGVSFFAVLFLTLVLPAYSMTKASYALSMTVPLAIALADGFARVHRALDTPRLRVLGVVVDAWAIAFLAVVALAFCG